MTTKVFAVIAGTDCKGQDFNTLRLFDCFADAIDYAVDLEDQLEVDLANTSGNPSIHYVLIQTREVHPKLALCAA